MIKRYFIAFLSIAAFCFPQNTLGQIQLSVEKIMQDPKKWIGTSPSEVFWGENNSEIFFKWNPDANPGDSLYKYVVSEGKIKKVSQSERLEMPEPGAVFSSDRSMKVYEKLGDIYLRDQKTGRIRQITNTEDVESNPSFSTGNQAIFFRLNNQIYHYNIREGNFKQITNFLTGTSKAEKKKTEEEQWLQNDQLNIFEVISEHDQKEKESKKNELKKKSPKKIFIEDKRIAGLMPSPSGNFVIYNLSTSPKDAKGTVVPNYVTKTGYTEELSVRSKVGSPQNSSESFVYDIKADTVWKLSYKSLPGINQEPDFLKDYKKDTTSKKKTRELSLVKAVWSPDGTILIGDLRSVDHKDRWIVKIDPNSGSTESLDHQRDEAWISGPGIGGGFGGATLEFIDKQTIIFQSEKTGYLHLYSFDLINKNLKQLTVGKFEIQGFKISADKKTLFITANKEHPGVQHFYHLPIEGGELKKITSMVGANLAEVSPDEKWLAIRYSYSNKPWELYLQKNEPESETKQLTHSTTKDFESYAWKEPQIISFKASDSQEIFARIYSPKKKHKKAVIFVHGAGYLQNAHKWWSSYFREYMFHNLLVDRGYTVLDIDYRASAGYGRDVRTGIYRHMGGKDLSDNVDGAKLLVEKYGIDAGKIGIYGGSYGGFITLMGLFTTPDVFKAGAALRPVTDWAAYNHEYTSNILNTPQADSIAYKKSSPIYFASGLKNHLLICHGVVDVNVHYQDVVRLSQRLIELKKDNWELASYPMEDHGFVEPSSWTDEYKRILKLFEEKLK